MPTNLSARFCTYILSLFLIAFALPAFAGPFEDAVAKFANDDYSDTEEAIGVVASSGNALAFPIISALQDGRLMADPDSKKVYVTGADGKSIDAATGQAVASVPTKANASTAVTSLGAATYQATTSSVTSSGRPCRSSIVTMRSGKE